MEGWLDDFECKLAEHLHPSEPCFDDFISPMINFVFFEDPRTLTEARAVYVYHTTPNPVGNLGGTGVPGGNIELFAVQVRAALNERLSVTATKDGFIFADIDPGPLDGLLNDGWADINLGLKYNLVRDPEAGFLLSTGLWYELPIGSTRALQAVGDGEFYGYLTAGKRYHDGCVHFLTSLGYRLPANHKVQTSSLQWSTHTDFKLTETLYFLSESAWWHWTDSADVGLPLGVAGQDLFNLPSTNVSDRNLITKAFGLKYKPNRNVETGVSYEFPLTDFQDVINDRWQFEFILRY
jgi:hypothetical protein